MSQTAILETLMDNLTRAVATILGMLAPMAAATEPGTTGYQSASFDGETLHGWKVDGDCRVKLADGELRLESGTGSLRSNYRYHNFRLHAEWKTNAHEDCDVGLFFRGCDEDGRAANGGFVIDLGPGLEAKRPESNAAALARPRGEWNELDLAVVDQKLELRINSQQAYVTKDLNPLAGFIGLQATLADGESVSFRNLQITELDHRSLFNGRDLSGWEGAGRPASTCWDVRDGAIVCTSRRGPWLRNKQQVDDFNLRLEYLVAPGANSGIYVRVPSDGNHHRENDTLPSAGFEVQILDDAAPKYAELKDYQYSGSVYDIAGARQHVGKPAGEWNTLEINCLGHHVTTFHNGVQIVDANSDEFPLLKLRRLKGYLGLQNHGPDVQFRKLRIGPPSVSQQ